MESIARHLLIASALGLAFCSFGPQGSAAQPVTLSDSMPLDQIDAALEAYPPTWENGSARHAIFASMDQLVTVRVNRRAGMSDADRQRLAPLRDFYRKRVDRGLDTLESLEVQEGVHAVKFYSSSYVFRSAQGTVAVDSCQGPTSTSRGEPEGEDELEIGFYLTPEQRDRLADQIDVMLITHRHHDHCDYLLAGRFRLSIHEYEMTHEGGGNRMAYRLAGALLDQVRNRQRMVLFWGEGFHLTPQLTKSNRTLLVN